MEPLQWQEAWSVGNTSLDDDHKRLVEIINQVNQSQGVGEDAIWIINDLKQYAKYHFAREEEMMEAAQIPGLEEHKKTHLLFVEWLSSLQHTINLPEARLVIFDTASSYLREWLGNHILGTDMVYKGKI